MTCKCIPDDATTARDDLTGAPQEWVHRTGFLGWFQSGWREVVCPEHGNAFGHLSPQACSRCNPIDCACDCHEEAGA